MRFSLLKDNTMSDHTHHSTPADGASSGHHAMTADIATVYTQQHHDNHNNDHGQYHNHHPKHHPSDHDGVRLINEGDPPPAYGSVAHLSDPEMQPPARRNGHLGSEAFPFERTITAMFQFVVIMVLIVILFVVIPGMPKYTPGYHGR